MTTDTIASPKLFNDTESSLTDSPESRSVAKPAKSPSPKVSASESGKSGKPSASSEPEAKSAPVAQPVAEKLSKSARIRKFMEQHPEARNRDIVEALAEFGVGSADVGNVKSAMKRAEGTTKTRKKTSGRSTGAASKSTAKAPAVPAVRQAASATTAPVAGDVRVSMNVLEAAMEFVQAAGGLKEAENALLMIRRIRSL